MEALTALVERAINGVELPDYAGVPDSGAPAGPPITPPAAPPTTPPTTSSAKP